MALYSHSFCPRDKRDVDIIIHFLITFFLSKTCYTLHGFTRSPSFTPPLMSRERSLLFVRCRPSPLVLFNSFARKVRAFRCIWFHLSIVGWTRVSSCPSSHFVLALHFLQGLRLQLRSRSRTYEYSVRLCRLELGSFLLTFRNTHNTKIGNRVPWNYRPICTLWGYSDSKNFYSWDRISKTLRS